MDRAAFIELYGKLTRNVRVMALSTWSGEQPWVANVYFASMGADLLFYSSHESNHCKHLDVTPKVAAAFHTEAISWQWINGAQVTGECEKVSSTTEKAKAMAAYFMKYPFAKEFFINPGSFSKVLADKLSRVCLYILRVETVTIRDNTNEFGRMHKMMVRDGKFLGDPL